MTAADPALIHARNTDGVPLIVWARYVGKPEMADLLAAQGGELALDEACAVGRDARVRELLDAGELVDGLTSDGFTPLHYAAFFGHLPLARLLVDRGAGLDVPARNDMHVTALHSATAGRHTDIALLLIDAGADVHALQRGGWTALHAAAKHGDQALAGALLAKGASPTAKADDGTTPAELATAAGHHEMVELLGRRPG